MAVSTYCTAVWISCSSMVGPARASTVGSRDQANMDFFSVSLFIGTSYHTGDELSSPLKEAVYGKRL